MAARDQAVMSGAERAQLTHARSIMRNMRAGIAPPMPLVEVLDLCRLVEMIGTPVDRINAAAIRREVAICEQLDSEGVADRARRRRQLLEPPLVLPQSRRVHAPQPAADPTRAFVAGVFIGVCIQILFF